MCSSRTHKYFFIRLHMQHEKWEKFTKITPTIKHITENERNGKLWGILVFLMKHRKKKHISPSILLVILQAVKIENASSGFYYTSKIHCLLVNITRAQCIVAKKRRQMSVFRFMSNSLRFFTFWSQNHIHSDPHKDTKRHNIYKHSVFKFFIVC